MRSEGYDVRWTDNRKNITYTTPDGKKCRDDRLHDEKYIRKHRRDHRAHLAAIFSPWLRCEILKYTKYSCDFTPCQRKNLTAICTR
jgi:hypothetical protein